jgi:hypothetical protein
MRKLHKLQFINSDYFSFLFLVVLNFAIFHEYWLGISTPPWDFLGGGMVEQYRFYKDGGFFNPPNWFPYAWFGIPEYQLLQDGGWFIPVAIVAEIFGWHPANAARLQSGLVLIGSIGFLLLSRIFIQKEWISIFCASLYMFIPAYYSNAQHYGVVRSAALLPWILYFVHPKTLLKGQLQIFFGALIIFQTMVGSYPGNLISSIYTVIFFILVFCIKSNSQYFFRLTIMSLSGLLMGLVRYLPILGARDSFPSNVGNQAGITFYNAIYLIFPFVGNNLPWEDLTLRSLYIGTTALALIFLYDYKIKNINKWLFISIFSVLMMALGPINYFLRNVLPLADVSRFAITDWRNTFNIGIIMIAGLILNQVVSRQFLISKIRIILFFVSVFYLGFQAIKYGQSISIVLIFIVFLLLSYIAIWKSRSKKQFSYLIMSVSLLSGVVFVFLNNFSWSTTVKEQNFNIYNNSFTNVQQTMVYPMKFRPERVTFLPLPLTPENYKNDQRYNRFWLTGGFGAFGYHNIKDISAYSALFPRLEKESDPVVSFLMSKSKQLAIKDTDGLEQKLFDCVNSIGCPSDVDVKISQVSFDKEREVFRINSSVDFILVQNEMFSPVWSGTICASESCLDVPAYAVLDSLRSWSLPKGDYVFETNATTPLNNIRWLLFIIGFTVALMTTKFPKLNFKRRSSI